MDTYTSFPHHILRVDFVRYLMMYIYGGVIKRIMIQVPTITNLAANILPCDLFVMRAKVSTLRCSFVNAFNFVPISGSSCNNVL